MYPINTPDLPPMGGGRNLAVAEARAEGANAPTGRTAKVIEPRYRWQELKLGILAGRTRHLKSLLPQSVEFRFQF